MTRDRAQRHHRRRTETGAAAVEFALVVPILLLLVFGIISFAFLLTFRQNLSQAAGEGARAAAVQLDDSKRSTAAADAVTEALRTAGLTCASGQLREGGAARGSCTIGAPTACAGDISHKCVTITLSYGYRANPTVPSFPPINLVMPQTVSYASTIRVS